MWIKGYITTPLSPYTQLATSKQVVSNNNTPCFCLAIISSQHFGLYSSLAIFCNDTWPSEAKSLSPQLTCGGSGQRRQVGRCPLTSVQFWTKNSHFWPRNL